VRRTWTAGLLLAFAGVVWGQEGWDQHAADLRRAEVVVVGVLEHRYTFPWIDGWNERGRIVVEEVLKGDAKVREELPFGWERDFRQGWCLTRADWRGEIGRRGVWVLRREGGRYRAEMFGGFLPMEYLDRVRAELRAVR
jgi:hypothetical protein